MPALDYAKKLETLDRRMDRSEDLVEEDEQLLREFRRDLHAQDYLKARIYKLLSKMTIIAEQMDTTLENSTKEDIKELLAWVNKKDLAPAAKGDYRIILKRFFKWENGGDHPEKVKWVSSTLKGSKKDKILPRNLLVEVDVRDLIDAALNSRDRALVALLWETGARIGELMDATIADVEEHKHGKQIVLYGKTGARRIPLIQSTPPPESVAKQSSTKR